MQEPNLEPLANELVKRIAKAVARELEPLLSARLTSQDTSHPNPAGVRIIPLTEWSAHHPYPTTSALRSLVFNEHQNGFSKCVRRVGRRVLISERDFFKWLDGKKSGRDRDFQKSS